MPETLAPGGFQLDRYEESRDKFVTVWTTAFGPGSNTASDTPDGHIIDWGTAMAQACLDKAGAAYQSGFLLTAGTVNGAAQLLGPLFGSFPQPATSSTGSVLAFGVVGTTIVVGSSVSTVGVADRYQMDATDDIAQDRWVIFQFGPALVSTSVGVQLADFDYGNTLGIEGSGLFIAQQVGIFLNGPDAQIKVLYDAYEDANGNGVLVIETNGIIFSSVTSSNSEVDNWRGSLMDVTAEAEGPVKGEAFTITRINDSVADWEGVVNLASVTTGSEQDNLARYIQRHLDTLGKNGTSTQIGLLGRLRDENRNPGIEYAQIYNNPFGLPDAAGRPDHSFETVTLGGTLETIADLVWRNHPLGIQAFGAITTIVTDPDTEQDHIIGLTVATELFIWVDITITPGEGFPVVVISDLQTQVANDTVAFGQTRGVGLNAYTADISASWKLTGVDSFTIKMGTRSTAAQSKPTLSSGNLMVDDLAILRWDSIRIDVVVN